MQGLLQEELVVQVVPGMYVHRIQHFSESFASYLEGLAGGLAERRQAFDRGVRVKIHMEKIGDISRILLKNKLARDLGDYRWYEVESSTAADFMAYLALILGHHDEVQATPLTDELVELTRMQFAGVPAQVTIADLE